MLRAVSLYSGAGGLDLGFVNAGFDVVWAAEADLHARHSYARLVGAHVHGGEAALPPTGLSADVVIGGPPCQGFSVVGRQDPGDHRSRHVHRLLDIVERCDPVAFVMENVKQLGRSPAWRGLREALIERSEDLGYRTELWVLNAADHGVAQRRERMFLVGSRGAALEEPEPRPGPPVSVRQALEALPPFGRPGNDLVTGARIVPAPRPVVRRGVYRGSLIFNGNGRPVDLDAPCRTLTASIGGNAAPIIDQFELMHRKRPWVVDYHDHLLAGGAPMERAPGRLRRMTVQEAAALQGFPPGFVPSGPRSAQYRQIGNAVPPPLAEAVGRAVKESVEAARGAAAELGCRALDEGTCRPRARTTE